MKNITIQEDIRKAFTLPTAFYKNETYFEASKEKIFAKTWQYAADSNQLPTAKSVVPFTLLENVLNEPLVLTKDKNQKIYCLSNVCTHRGKIIVEAAGEQPILSCGYHGRCFRLDGSFKSMPEFEHAENFPSEEDHLPNISIAEWSNLIFTALNPAVSFEKMIAPINERLSWLPLNTLTFDAEKSKDYFVDGHWALYCDNFLEGFHIPFVHPTLNNALNFQQYDYEIFPYCNLQVGIAKEGEPCFEIPEGAKDFGKKIYAYYWWLFPNLMFNFYPWGLSLNVIQPLSHQKTKVSFRSYFFEGNKLQMEDNALDQTELEDEAVVESVQKGIQSRFYKRGRFSPTMEQGVHHFHRLIAEFMK